MRSSRHRLRASAIESLENRLLMAAHVMGFPAVYTTIQAAVDAAPWGATVQVDAGTYDEMVTVNKPLTLRGAAGGTSVVDGQLEGTGRSSAFYITADDVTIDGFTVQGQTSSVQGAGIVLKPLVAGTQILNNVIQNNSVGLYLANSSSTDPAIIRHNTFAYNNNPGDNYGRGIYSDGGVSGGLLTNVLIDSNLFIGNVGNTSGGNAEAAIGLEAQLAPQSNITITNNVMVGNGKGVLMSSLSGAVIANNYIAGCVDVNSAALRAEGGVNGVVITGNNIVSNGAAAVRLDSKINGLSNSGFLVTGNNFAENPAGGVVITAGTYDGALDASRNFWGSPTGPSGAGPGTGDAVIPADATVLFTPWNTKPFASPANTAPSLRNSPLINSAGSLQLPGGQHAALAAGVYVLSSLNISGGSVLTVNGPTTIYVTGAFTLSGGSQLLTLSRRASDLSINVIGTAPVTLSGGSLLYGSLDAPLASVTLSGGSKLFGSILDDLLLNLSGGSAVIPTL